jgi:GT2 family glycosyltransferase
MASVSVTVVIPTWNRRDLLIRVLASLAQQTRRPDQVIVVDNASEDESADAAADAGARVIRLPHNAGFAPAVNRGIAAANTTHIAIVNNDVDLAPDWLALLLAALAEHPGTSFATGKIFSAHEPDRLDGAFDLIARSGFAWRAGHGRQDGPLWNQPREIRVASMTAALFRRDLFTEIGALDEDYGSYYEDVDFGLRCALAGKNGRYVPLAHAWHEGGATLGAGSRAMVEHLTRNQRLLVRKHFPQKMSWPVFAGQALWGALAWRRGHFGAWREGRRQANSAAISIPGPAASLAEVLAQSERELLALQQHSGADTYWNLYAKLTRAPASP